MRLQLDYHTLNIIDDHFDTDFENLLNGNLRNIDNLFNWTHPINNLDLDDMYRELQREIDVGLYVATKYIKSPIAFLNYLLKSSELSQYYIKPLRSQGFIVYYTFGIRN